MAATTRIEWTDATWNPMTGCTKISRGCDHCYAEVVARSKTRALYLAGAPLRDTVASRADPFAPRFWTERVELPLRWRTPKRIFVNSMSDLFHAQFTTALIEQVFAVMGEATWHQFQILTKRPERALRLADRLPWPANVWMGTTIEDATVTRRADVLRQIPAAVRFVSAEPLLGPLGGLDLTDIHWVIGGGESGRGHRPCDPTWARELRDLCLKSDVAFFWKQWGGITPKAGGRLLDGREWNEYPVALINRCGDRVDRSPAGRASSV